MDCPQLNLVFGDSKLESVIGGGLVGSAADLTRVGQQELFSSYEECQFGFVKLPLLLVPPFAAKMQWYPEHDRRIGIVIWTDCLLYDGPQPFLGL